MQEQLLVQAQLLEIKLAGAVMNAIIPFSGTLYKKSIDSKAMGYGKTKKKTVMHHQQIMEVDRGSKSNIHQSMQLNH